MKHRIFTLAALYVCFCVAAFAQQPKPPATLGEALAQIASLSEQVANLKMQLATVKLNMLNQTANPIISERQEAIKELEALHPGMHWDDKQGILVANAPPPADKK